MAEAEQIELEGVDPAAQEQPAEPAVASEAEQPAPGGEVDPGAAGAEPPAGEQERPPKVEFTPEQQAVFDREIGKRVKREREAEQKALEAAKKAEKAEEALRAAQEPERPVVPPKPDDPYAPDFDDRMTAYTNALADQRVYDARQEEAQAAAIAAREEQQRQAEATYRQQAAEYIDRGEKLGLSGTEMDAASSTIDSFGVHPAVKEHLITDDRGPEMAVYLANNIIELQKVAEMHPMRAAVYLETVVKEAAKRPAPKVTPAPPTVVEGGLAPVEEDGITLE